MKILIEYESSWRNSFLDGDNNEPLPKGGRNFIGSMTNLKKKENFKQRNVTLDTVMGLLNRLIGDQRKLYQARNDENYYFKDIEQTIEFKDKPLLTNEMTYIRNMTGSTDQNSFTGMIKTDDVMFSSDYSPEFWGILALDFDELCNFILMESIVHKTIEMNPLSIVTRLETIKKDKPVANEGEANKAMELLMNHFPKIKPLNKKEEIKILPLYCSSLYLQLERLSERFDMTSAKAPMGGLSGISHNGFTVKNIMERFTTGKQKKVWGNPYQREEFVKGQGKVISMMTKASGKLEIEIPVEREKVRELKTMIENAGVSSFYLGKKGLAYVSKIRI